MVQIVSFKAHHQEAIKVLMDEITREFKEPISLPNATTQQSSLDQYWIALKNEQVIGSIGILKLNNKNAALKRMFVQKHYRGKENGISIVLLQTAIDWCKQENITSIFLGTMTQFKAAHRFYEKNGFQKIEKSELPIDFTLNPIDTIFYKKQLLI